MLKALLVSFRRVVGLTGSAIREPTFDVLGAGVVMLGASTWELAKGVVAHPESLVIWPATAALIVLLGSILFSVGALVWLIWVLAIAVGRSLLIEKFKPGQAWPAIVGTAVLLLFLGLPELCDKFVWWQEHLASWQEHYFNRIPGEPAALTACQEFIQSLSDRRTIAGLIFMAAIGLLVFWQVRRRLPDEVRHAAMTIRRLVTGRKWPVPTVLIVAILLTTSLVIFHPSPWLLLILLCELIAMLIWLLLPVIRDDLFSIVVAVTWLIPVLIVTNRIGGSLYLLWFGVSAPLWGAWLVCSIRFHAWPWRFVFRVGTLAFAAYIICGPGSV